MTKNIAILASGSGTNAERIIFHFRDHPQARVTLVLSNRPDAYVLTRASNLGIPTEVFTREDLRDGSVLKKLKDKSIDVVVLAGFLWLIPETLVHAYSGRMINIHPALLPRHGGKGMYGDKVHQAVKDNLEMETGITIHWVNEKYDQGDILMQKTCKVEPEDTIEDIAAKVHALEYQYYPQVIESIVKNL
jgi:phosphoribosylglycinamide formyltransferase 1